jgi:hypothetical protein
MPQNVSYAKVFRDLEGLIGGCERNLGLLPGVEPLIEELAGLFTQARDLKLEQEDLEGHRRAITQRLLESVDTLQEKARAIRNLIKVCLGPRSEHLTQFGIQPLRRRPRRPGATEPESPPSPPVEIAAPESGTSPPKQEGEVPPATTMDANPQ